MPPITIFLTVIKTQHFNYTSTTWAGPISIVFNICAIKMFAWSLICATPQTVINGVYDFCFHIPSLKSFLTDEKQGYQIGTKHLEIASLNIV